MNNPVVTPVLDSCLDALPEGLAQPLEPLCRELARAGARIREVRVGPLQPAREFLDIETVRLRIAQEQGGQLLPGQAALVDGLRKLPGERTITYVILETASRAAKCYVDPDARQLLGVLWLSAADSRNEGDALQQPA